jgi:hypothetical protein
MAPLPIKSTAVLRSADSSTVICMSVPNKILSWNSMLSRYRVSCSNAQSNDGRTSDNNKFLLHDHSADLLNEYE